MKAEDTGHLHLGRDGASQQAAFPERKSFSNGTKEGASLVSAGGTPSPALWGGAQDWP